MTVVRFPVVAMISSLHHRVQTSYEAHPASYPMCTGESILALKQPEREPDHLRPSSSEVKSVLRSYSSIPHTPSRCGA